jgi:hypothetical protein
MRDSIERIRSFADGVRHDGFTDVVLLGMGGSSLAPEVLRAVVGVTPGWPAFHMLDSTDPAAVRAVAAHARTLFMLASKSGTTIEPNSLAAHFRRVLEESGIPRWADHFVAITDEGTALAERARAERFRETFINPSDIGGRYSALSFFGLVPAALMGQDIAAMLDWAIAMLSASDPHAAPEAADNPSVALGLAIAAGAFAGRDKMTLIVPPALEPFGIWIEQLVAESTGKEGVGVVPIAGETDGPPAIYGRDRLFVRMRLADAAVETWQAPDAPLVDIDVAEPAALGAEFVRWEVATAVAGTLLHINPFDEPNVQQAKDATRRLLTHHIAHKAFPAVAPDRDVELEADSALTGADNRATLTLSDAARSKLGGSGPEAFLTLLHPPDYLALLAFVGPDHDIAAALHAFRMEVRDRTRAATMFGYGPRYLHSTGQLHKGGPDTGVFVLVTATPIVDLPIPTEPFSFGTLELAQALGDFSSLGDAGRRALHVHLPAPDAVLIRQVTRMLLDRIG